VAKNKSIMKILLIGIQGAGKSTQGNRLSKKLKIPYLSSGHIFRQMAKEKTPWGRYVKETVNSGALIPDQKTIEIIEEYLKKPEYEKGYILDGFPRTVEQARMFSNGIDVAFYLDVSEKEAVWRLFGRMAEDIGVREDNTLDAIKRRIDSFHQFTKPVITYYRRRRILEDIDGERKITEIFRDITSRLPKYEDK
jgi:adenylate kinase